MPENGLDKSIAVLSTGTIGSSIGADLTRAGYKVVLIDQWPAHVEAMKADGLTIALPEEELHTPVEAIHLCELSARRHQFDIVFLTAKSHDTVWMVHLIKPYLKQQGMLVSVQNSLNDEWIAPIIGYERDMGCVVELSGEILEPGHVRRNTDHAHTWFALGELHGRITPRLQEAAKILSSSGVAEASTNIWGAKWSKLVVNTMSQGLCGILGIYNWELVQHSEALRFSVRLGRESLLVGTTLGYRVEPLFGMTMEDLLGSTDEVVEKALMILFSNIGKRSRCAVLQDHLKGRRSEVEYLNGLVVAKGREARVPTPFNEAVMTLTKRIEPGEMKPGPSNFSVLKELVAQC